MRKGGKEMWVPLMHPPLTGDLARNLGIYPDWELN